MSSAAEHHIFFETPAVRAARCVSFCFLVIFPSRPPLSRSIYLVISLDNFLLHYVLAQNVRYMAHGVGQVEFGLLDLLQIEKESTPGSGLPAVVAFFMQLPFFLRPLVYACTKRNLYSLYCSAWYTHFISAVMACFLMLGFWEAPTGTSSSFFSVYNDDLVICHAFIMILMSFDFYLQFKLFGVTRRSTSVCLNRKVSLGAVFYLLILAVLWIDFITVAASDYVTSFNVSIYSFSGTLLPYTVRMA